MLCNRYRVINLNILHIFIYKNKSNIINGLGIQLFTEIIFCLQILCVIWYKIEELKYFSVITITIRIKQMRTD